VALKKSALWTAINGILEQETKKKKTKKKKKKKTKKKNKNIGQGCMMVCYFTYFVDAVILIQLKICYRRTR